MAYLTLEEVSKIDLFAQDTFFQHFDMYKFSLTYKDELSLATEDYFSLPKEDVHLKIGGGTDVKFSEIAELKEYFSAEE